MFAADVLLGPLVGLTTHERFVVWDLSDRDPRGKLRKVPLQARNPAYAASTTAPATWSTFDEAAAACARNPVLGLGYVTTADDEHVFIDVDGCRNPETGEIDAWARQIIGRTDTYVEVTPSQTGLRVIGYADPEMLAGKHVILASAFGGPEIGHGGKGAQVEVFFNAGPYVTISSQRLRDFGDSGLKPVGELAREILRHAPAPREHTPNLNAALEDIRDLQAAAVVIPNPLIGPVDSGLRDDWHTYKRVAMAFWAASAGSAEGEAVFAAWSSKNTSKHTDDGCATCWNEVTNSPPDRIGGGSVIAWAQQAATDRGAKFLQPSHTLPPGGWPTSDGTPVPAPVAGYVHLPNGAVVPRLLAPPPAEAFLQLAAPVSSWSEPLDILADRDSVPPTLKEHHVPAALFGFARDTSERMGVDACGVALACIVTCASVVTDDWCVQPRRFDSTWAERPRLWGAIVGNPSILKTPVINACTGPVDLLESAARRRHETAKHFHKAAVAEAKKSGSPEPPAPRLDRYIVENTTIEMITEILRDDPEATQRAPAKKVLIRQNEMSEFFANMGRYTGGKSGGDRGVYLRLYDGGSHTSDRVGRGSFRVEKFSGCFLGGIQPDPIRKIARNTNDDGLLQRFLYCVPGPQGPGVDREPDNNALDRYTVLVHGMAALQPPGSADSGKPAVKFHPDAQQHRERVEAIARGRQYHPDTSKRLEAAFGKWPGMYARLALTFHLIEMADALWQGKIAEDPLIIPEATAKRAADFMREIALPHLLRAEDVMFETAQTGHARWIAGYIVAHGCERITTRDVVRSYKELKTPEDRNELTAVMASLVDAGWLEPVPSSNSAKPVGTWMVNPVVHSVFGAKAEQEKARRQRGQQEIAAGVAALRHRSTPGGE